MSMALCSRKNFYPSFCWSCRQLWRSKAGLRLLRNIGGELSDNPLAHFVRFLSPNTSTLPVRYVHTSSQSCRDSSVSTEVGGSSVNFSTGKFAKLASGSALVESGSTSVLVTAVSEYKADSSASWLPLQVDYRERGSATNKIPQTFFRRELRPSTKEYLACRFIDRSIRPLFPNGYYYNTQIICNMLAVDGNEDHEILAVNGAAAALMLSDIPWNGPIGVVRVCLMDGKFCINPSTRKQSACQLNLIVACTKDRIVMVEGSGEEVPEDMICEAVHFALSEAQPLLESLSELAQHRRVPTRESHLFLPSQHVLDTVRSLCREQLMTILCTTTHSKMSRDEQLFSLLDATKKMLATDELVDVSRVGDAFWGNVHHCMQELVLERGIRCDGRGFNELRNIECEVDTFKLLHGTAVFRRGETQVLCTVTFDSPGSAVKADILQTLLGAQKTSSFIVHYEFPPFATNSIGNFMNHNRREAGHGALAEKALTPLLPKNFPFTIRLNSQVLDSNGSSSMATICGGSLALFDAGVPMPRPVAGVACGLVSRTHPETGEIDQYQIITDLLGIEDANGNMDYKVGGTREGVTSIQMDVKNVLGIPFHIFEEALIQSKAARFQVLDIMDECLSAPREELKKNRPAQTVMEVAPDKLGRLLGVGGHRMKGVAEDTGTTFQVLGEGQVSVFGPSQEAVDEFIEKADSFLKEDEQIFEIGSVIKAKVLEVREIGLMVELSPRVYTLLHISRISHDFITHPSQIGVVVGDTVNVKYLGKDFLGKHLVSRKALTEPPPKPDVAQSSMFSVGQVIQATVKELVSFGIVMELAPDVSGLLHIRNLDHAYIRQTSDLGFKPGDIIPVQYMGIDNVGRHEVSRKALLSTPPQQKFHPQMRFEPGQVIPATVKEVRDIGVMLELAPDVNALLHIRNLQHSFVRHPSQLGFKPGDKLSVKYMGSDEKGRHMVSRKALLPPPDVPDAAGMTNRTVVEEVTSTVTEQ